jgi:predicted acyltransferase (DUF342 family)
LEACYLDADEPVCLDHATAPHLTLTRCQLAGLTGDTLSTQKVDLSGSTLTGPLRLPVADIAGQLICSGAKLTGQDSDGNALVGDQMKAGAEVLLDGKFTAAGAVRLPGADITGQLDCTDAKLNGQDKDRNALVGDGMKVGGNVYLRGKFTAAGAIRLPGADIKARLDCTDAKLNGQNQRGNALVGDGMKVGAEVLLGGKFTAAGAIRLQGADITGELNCAGAKLTGQNQRGNALVGDGMKVGADVFLGGRLTAAGVIRLQGADITGQLDCTDAKLKGQNNNGNALVGDEMKVGADVYLGGKFTAAGAIRLSDADITGELDCTDAKLNGQDKDRNALVGDGMKVGADVYLRGKFTAAGRSGCPARTSKRSSTALMPS